ncbi:ankyrin [Fusarium mundagurra]|uniref:Ankyrin n=1 Tax=Fusarium mundagurra TaxID=1567541 RepID=A0A8H5YG94_9HYPO|nr:ankyrin [Fusarium mundagurra]
MSGIFAVSQEVWDCIFNYLDLGSLASAYECNIHIRNLVEKFFSNCYYASKPDTPAGPCDDPYQIIQRLLSPSDSQACLAADEILAQLHKRSDRGGPSWKGTVAMALIPRRYYDASEYFYLSSLENLPSDKGKKRNAFFTAARFGRDPEPGAELKPDDKCWASAWKAYHRKTNDIKVLELSGEQFTNVEAYNPATMAAISGEIGILKHLHSVGFDLWPYAYHGPNVPGSPLAAALQRGHESVVEYLCDDDNIQWLTDDQVSHACRTAAPHSRVDVLRRIEKCHLKETNDWYCNYAGAGGGLYPNRIDWYIFGPEKPPKEPERVAMLQHFIKKEWYKIHAIDRDGNNVLHLAAAEGSLDLFRILWNDDAKEDQLNNAGQSPIELAGNGESGIANWLSKERRMEITITRKQKIKPARMIIKAQRQLRTQEILVRLLHNYGRKDLSDKEEPKKILETIIKQWDAEKMDEKLADIWVHYYSFTAMNAYIDKASKVLEVISSGETLFDILLGNLEDSGWFIRKSEFKESKVKFRNEESRRYRDIAGFLFFFNSVYSAPQLAKIIQGLPSADLAEIETYRHSKEGEMLKAGSEAAWGHENKIRSCFEDKLGTLDELSKYR